MSFCNYTSTKPIILIETVTQPRFVFAGYLLNFCHFILVLRRTPSVVCCTLYCRCSRTNSMLTNWLQLHGFDVTAPLGYFYFSIAVTDNDKHKYIWRFTTYQRAPGLWMPEIHECETNNCYFCGSRATATGTIWKMHRACDRLKNKIYLLFVTVTAYRFHRLTLHRYLTAFFPFFYSCVRQRFIFSFFMPNNTWKWLKHKENGNERWRNKNGIFETINGHYYCYYPRSAMAFGYSE